MAEFFAWKNEEGSSTKTSYVRTQQTYHPASGGIMYSTIRQVLDNDL